jgi:hypothetical protein
LYVIDLLGQQIFARGVTEKGLHGKPQTMNRCRTGRG